MRLGQGQERGRRVATFDLAHLTTDENVHWGKKEVRRGRYSKLNGPSNFGPNSPDATPNTVTPLNVSFMRARTLPAIPGH